MKRTYGVPIKLMLALLSGACMLVLALWLIAAPPVAGQGPPGSLPVFRMIFPPVNRDNVESMANMFDQIGGRDPFTETTRLGTLRYTLGNTATGAIFEQYGATGGFFAHNAQVAFGDGSVRNFFALNADRARELACGFLTFHQLFPNEAQFIDCAVGGENLPYQVIVANSTVLTPAAGFSSQAITGISTTRQIAMIVQVPLAISTRTGGDIPLRGPGGHLSVLLVSTNLRDPITPALDSAYPGVAALAEPWYDRQLESRGDFDVLPAAQASRLAVEILSQQLPEGAQVNPGTPELVYWAEEAAAEQPNLLPEWYFPNATAVVDGQTVNMRGIHFPAVQGFNPTVQITQPANGSRFVPGEPVNLVGTISGGNGGPPYEYQWLLDDDTVLGSGNSSGGTVSLNTTNLPFALHNGEPALVTVRLVATDKDGASASAAVTLQPSVLFAYVPLVLRTGGGVGQAQNADIPAAAPPYKVLAEYVRFYNGHGADLPGTVADGTGFYNGLGNYGWSKTFLWSNNLAWEKDWRDCSLGGGDCAYGADIADFAYFSGHGSVARIYFGVNKDAYNFYGGNARFNNVRWVGFSSCNTIRGTDISHWFSAFQGAHMLLGFHSVMADVAFGGPLVENMRIPKLLGLFEIPAWQLTIREAWVKTAFDLNAGRPAYIYAVGTNGVNPVNNKLPKGGDPALPRPFPVASYHWVWWSLPGD